MSVHKKQKTDNGTYYYSNTRFAECKSSHIWKIKGFLNKCPLVKGKCLESSKFNVTGSESNFYMRLYPKGLTKDDTVVSLFMRVDNGKPTITCKFALIDTSGREVNEIEFKNGIIGSEGLGFSNFITRNNLQKQKLVLLPDDQLTVSCVVTIYGEAKMSSGQFSGSSTDGHTIGDDWAAFFDGKEGADVILKVGNDSVPAHKSVMMCRSPVFSAMFKSDMREGNTGQVHIKDIDRDVFVALLTFLYTDRLSVSDVAFAMKLLVAAEKYDVQLLRSRCAQYLAENLSKTNVLDILLVADACRCKELSQKCCLLIESEMSFTDIMTQLDGSPNLIGVIKKHLNPK